MKTITEQLTEAEKRGFLVVEVPARFPFQGQAQVRAFIFTNELRPSKELYIVFRQDGFILDKEAN